MEISYSTIIKYLSSEIENENIIKPNLISNHENFPEKIKKLLPDNFQIYGTLNKNYSNINVSLWTSVLFLLDKKFILLSQKEQFDYIERIKTQMQEYLKKNFKKFKNRKKFSKIFCLEILRSEEKIDNPLLIELISFCFKINIIIVDFESFDISTITLDEYFNPWIPTIFLSKVNKFWQPLLTNKNKIFNFESLKFIFDKDIIYYCHDYLEQNFSLLDNIFEILEMDPSNKKKEENVKEISNDTFIKNLDLNKNKLKKMKKNDLINLIKEFNMNIDIKQTKDKLINEILMT